MATFKNVNFCMECHLSEKPILNVFWLPSLSSDNRMILLPMNYTEFFCRIFDNIVFKWFENVGVGILIEDIILL